MLIHSPCETSGSAAHSSALPPVFSTWANSRGRADRLQPLQQRSPHQWSVQNRLLLCAGGAPRIMDDEGKTAATSKVRLVMMTIAVHPRADLADSSVVVPDMC